MTAFAPADPPAGLPAGTRPAGGPEIVVVVLVEAGGEGSSVAAPIARKILEEWFGK